MVKDFRSEPIDAEISDLISALNLIPGVITQASCCGHGMDSFYVWLQCSTLESIVAISRVFNGNIISDDGKRTSYTVEVAPHHLMVQNDSQLDMNGNPIEDKNGKPVFCVNLIVNSTSLQGVSVDIGFADENTRRKEFQTLTAIALNVASELRNR